MFMNVYKTCVYIYVQRGGNCYNALGNDLACQQMCFLQVNNQL